MSDARFALLAAVREALVGDSRMSAVITGVFDPPPRNAAHPFLSFGEVRSSPIDGDAPPTLAHRLDVVAHSREPGRREASDLADLVQAALHHAELTLAGHRLVGIVHQSTDLSPSRDQRSFRARIRFRALTVASS